MPKIFAIGDLHLSFSIEKPMGIFGSIWVNHESKVLLACEGKIAADDILLILGDISWALKFPDADVDIRWIRDNLPGRKILLKGNHDLWWNSITRLREKYPEICFLQYDCILLGQDGALKYCISEKKKLSDEEPRLREAPVLAICGSRGWTTPSDPNFKKSEDEKIYKRELARMRMSLEKAKSSGAQQIIVCMHFPPAVGGAKSEYNEMFEDYGVKTVIYGHLHGKESWKKGLKGTLNGIEYRLVSADYIHFSPQLIGEY